MYSLRSELCTGRSPLEASPSSKEAAKAWVRGCSVQGVQGFLFNVRGLGCRSLKPLSPSAAPGNSRKGVGSAYGLVMEKSTVFG